MPSLVDFAYYAGLLLASPVLGYKVARKRGRRHLAGLKERLGECEKRPGRRPCIWIHGVSVGEIQAARTLVEAIERELPDYEIVLSTTTGTGQEVAKRSYPDKRVFYFPIDFTWSVARVFRAIRPSVVVLVELEIWPNFLHEAHRQRIPIALVNGRISAKSFRGYRFCRSLLFDPIGKIALFFVQTELYAERFRELGIPSRQIEITGSVKYDQLAAADLDAGEVRRDMGVEAEDLVIMGGSTHPSEEASLLEAYLALRDEFPNLRLVLVPRHTERSAELLESLRAKASVTQRTAQVEARGAERSRPLPPGEVLLVDTVGELGRLYSAADLVFVGGSLIPHGGQNMLEPVMFAKPTVFGPHWVNFEEPVKRLLAAEGVRELKGASELEDVLRELLTDPEAARAMGERGRAAMLAAQGATEATVQGLARFLKSRTARLDSFEVVQDHG